MSTVTHDDYMEGTPPERMDTGKEELRGEAMKYNDLTELINVYERYKHLDSVIMLVDDECDPFHKAAKDFWKTIKTTLHQ